MADRKVRDEQGKVIGILPDVPDWQPVVQSVKMRGYWPQDSIRPQRTIQPVLEILA